ncbi:hypothetical protein EGW08_001951, partial [Elysia chlorotica]
AAVLVTVAATAHDKRFPKPTQCRVHKIATKDVMELNIWVLLHTIPTVIVLRHTAGAMFDFRVTDVGYNFTMQDHNCQSLGYDGLAVVSTPEALEYANKISYYTRIVRKREMYVGNHFHLDTNEHLWDDGTVMTSDTPIDVAYIDQPYTRLKTTGTFARGRGTGIQLGLCGN